MVCVKSYGGIAFFACLCLNTCMVTTSTTPKIKTSEKTSELDKFKLFFEYAEPMKSIPSNPSKERTVRRQNR